MANWATRTKWNGNQFPWRSWCRESFSSFSLTWLTAQLSFAKFFPSVLSKGSWEQCTTHTDDMEIYFVPVQSLLVPGLQKHLKGKVLHLPVFRFENSCYHHVKPNVPGLFAIFFGISGHKASTSDLIIMKKPNRFTTFLALAHIGTN